MDYLFFGYLALCVLIAFAMFLFFIDRQREVKASGAIKTKVQDKASLEASVTVEKNDKKENNQ